LRTPWLDVAVAGGLAAMALLLALPTFGPTTIWRDDAWTALTIKTEGVSEFFLVAANAPGFAALLKGWVGLVGFDEWKAQLVPLLFAVATPALFYGILVWRGLERVAAAAGAFLLAVSPEFLVHAARLKQYTLDTFCVVGLLGLAWWLLDDVKSARRWRVVAAGGIVALVLSSPSVLFLVAALGTGLIGLWLEDRSRLRVALPPIAVAGACTVLWWLLVLRPAVSPTLTSYWEASFVPIDNGPKDAAIASVVAARRFLEGAVAIREAEAALVLFAGAYLVVLWRRALLGLLLLAPLGIAFVLAMLEIAPLGTGRTDIYLYPAVMAAVAVAVDALAREARRATGIAVVASAGLLLLNTPTPVYPIDDVAPLVAEVEARSSAADAIVAYPLAAFQVALYTNLPINFSRSDETATGFRLRSPRENLSLPTESWQRDPLNFASAIKRVRKANDSVWVIVTARDDTIVFPTAPPGASATEQFVHYREASALPFRLRAIRDAFAVGDGPKARSITVERYVDRLMRNAGYRKVGPVSLRTDASLTHWRR